MSIPLTGAGSSVASGGGGTPEPAVLFLDTFTDADETSISEHTPDIDIVGDAYQILTTTGVIRSNHLEENTGMDLDAGVADYTVSFDMRVEEVSEGAIDLAVYIRTNSSFSPLLRVNFMSRGNAATKESSTGDGAISFHNFDAIDEWVDLPDFLPDPEVEHEYSVVNTADRVTAKLDGVEVASIETGFAFSEDNTVVVVQLFGLPVYDYLRVTTP